MNKIITGDAFIELTKLESQSVDVCITSPPYFGLRDYGDEKQIGQEETVTQYIDRLTLVFSQVKRVLKDTGTLWIVIGDSYAGSGKGRNANGTINNSNLNCKQYTNRGSVSGKITNTKSNGKQCKPKDLIGVPWMLAFKLKETGWYLRQEIIWEKPNAMPENVKDRCTRCHETIFMFSKNKQYFYNSKENMEPAVNGDPSSPRGSKGTLRPNKGMREKTEKPSYKIEMRNRRSVWRCSVKPYKGAHFATFPLELIVPIIKIAAPENGIVLDCFSGSGTVGVACQECDRSFIGIDINEKYSMMAKERIKEAKEKHGANA